MKPKHFLPLILFLVPTVVGSICLWPKAAREPVAIGGFALMLLSMIITYVLGLRLALHDCGRGPSASLASTPRQ